MGKTHGTARTLRKSREFIGQLETYLNQKLVEAGKAPVIDFDRSLYAETFVAHNPAALARLALYRVEPPFQLFHAQVHTKNAGAGGASRNEPV